VGRKLNTSVFNDFGQRWIRHSKGQEGFLIMDEHPVHVSRRGYSWLEKYEKQISLFFPEYISDLNSDELLNQDVKTNALEQKGRIIE